MKRAIILMLDSFGIGATPDADQFGDAGANTLGHIAQACARGECDQRAEQYRAQYGDVVRSGALHIPNLTALGLAQANADATGQFPSGLDSTAEIIGAFGHAAELSSGKDTPSGHWEMAGVPVLFDWGYFSDKTNSFPQELLDRIVARAQLSGYLGNCHSSGTVILDELGTSARASRFFIPRRIRCFRSPRTRDISVWSVCTSCATSHAKSSTTTTLVG